VDVLTRALFFVSEAGYWGEECIEPLTTLKDAGVDVTVATPSGNRPVVDERSVDPDEVGEDTSEFVLDVHENDPDLDDPEPFAAVDPGEYDAVVFPGGHGTVWDVNQDRHARNALRTAVAVDDAVALVVCHAVGLLGFTRTEDDELLVDGRDVTGFPNAWEDGLLDEYDRLDDRKLPYRVEDEVVDAGGNWDAELDADTSVTVDGDLVTARGPPSSARAADVLLDELAD
jgi:putative intracellular protease/amidase